MPSDEGIWLTEKAVLWKASGFRNHGEPLVDEYGEPLIREITNVHPEEINVRWEDNTSEVTSQGGSNVFHRSIDATVAVEVDVPIGSLLWRGELEDWYGTGSAGNDNELMRVVRRAQMTDLKGNLCSRVVYLKRFCNTLPSEAS